MTDQSPQARIRQLEIENQRLQDEVDVLKDALSDRTVPLPNEWRLSRMQEAVFRVLLKRNVGKVSVIMATIYSERPDPPDDQIVSVFVYHLRRKLKPFGITIYRVRNVGYALDEATRAKFATQEQRDA